MRHSATPVTIISATCCTVIAIAVILYGSHAKDLAKLTDQLNLKIHLEDHTKIAADLHNHIDKANLNSLLKTSHPQADSRSLRLVRDYKTAVYESKEEGFLLLWRLGRILNLLSR